MDLTTANGLSKQLQLFEAGLPRKPYATDAVESGLHITSRRRALTRRYLQFNPPHLRVLTVYDVDRPGAVLAWEDADLPGPLFASANRQTGHAHLGWALDAPVLVEHEEARAGPLRFLCAVESLMRARLQADEGFVGLIGKNPLHPHWLTLWGPPYAYGLAELGEWLPGLEKHQPRRRPDRVGLGRNCDSFDWLRRYAYREIRAWWKAPRKAGVYVAWQQHLYDQAQSYTANEHRPPLDFRESWHVAKSVARYTWNNTTEDGFSKWSARMGAKAGQASGQARRRRTAERDAKIRRLRALGWTQQRIADEVGIPRRTVAYVLSREVVDESSTVGDLLD